ncbi:UNVERIFIED_CONTAM: DEAD/DEAH box helicase domain-containing protein [Hammondia hammondi]|eukprot:XP_008883083.1 DEAD/DEAH box helicase domain-containing protein [Hammondia hammondi]
MARQPAASAEVFSPSAGVEKERRRKSGTKSVSQAVRAMSERVETQSTPAKDESLHAAASGESGKRKKTRGEGEGPAAVKAKKRRGTEAAREVKQERGSDEEEREKDGSSTATDSEEGVQENRSGAAKAKKTRESPTAGTEESSDFTGKRAVSPADASPVSAVSAASSSVVKVIRKKGEGGILDTSQTFEEFGSLYLDRRLARVAVQHMQLQHPTHVQAQVIPLALQGKDLLAQARTGSGKTLAYALPLLQRLLERREEERATQPRPEGLEALVLVPSKELCLQIHEVFVSLLKYCRDLISVNHTAFASSSSLLPFLPPSVLIGTPAGVVSYMGKLDGSASVKCLLQRNLKVLVADEADLLLSFGFEHEMNRLLACLPASAERHYQALLLSATLNEEVAKLQQMLLHKAVMVEIDDTLQQASSQLSEFYLSLPKAGDKWVVLYAFLKLNLVPRKCLIFTSGVSSAYGVRIFLERFGIGCGVLSPTLSIESRQSLIQAFNKGLLEILITTDGAWDEEAEENEDEEEIEAADEDEIEEEGDEDEVDDEEDDEDGDAKTSSEEDSDDEEAGAEAAAEALKKDASEEDKVPKKKKAPKRMPDDEFGSHRGLDLQSVACVLSFDMPRSVRGYIHRIGRAGRGGAPGISVCLVSQAAAREVLLLHKLVQLRRESNDTGSTALKPLSLRLQDVECFRYRVEDVCRGVTKRVIAALVAKELQQEVLRSRKMRDFFKRNPRDEDVLRAACKQLKDRALAGRGHLQHLPQYLLAQTPPAQKTAVQLAVEAQKARGPQAIQEKLGVKRRTLVDPLKSFRAGSSDTRRGKRGHRGRRPISRESQLAREPNHAETAPEHLPALSGRKLWKLKHNKNLSKNQPKGNFLRVKKGKKRH